MMNKTILTLLVILICCSALAQATQISVEPPYVEVSEGGIFTVNITVYPEGNETYGAQYTLSFDNTLLNATEQTKGTFLSQDGVGTSVYTDKINNTLGEIKYSEARTGVDYGVTDPGVLTTIEFEVIAKHGTSGLLFDKAKLSTPGASYITGVVVNNGSVELVSGICGDVNGDDKVNIGDVIRLANHVGFPADPSYYPVDDNLADVNNDGKVNIGDVIRLANHVGFPADPRYTPDCG